jgi:translation initiation factor IF-2
VVPEGVLVIPLILKTDVAGMADAIAHELLKLNTEKVFLKIISSGTGAVTEGDIKNALPFASAIIIGFNVKVDSKAEELSRQHGITIKTFNIIYKLTEWLAETVKERTPKSEVEEVTGTLKVLKVFSVQKQKQVIGGRVQNGEITLKSAVRITRGESILGKGTILELQQAKVKTSTVSEGECGLMVESEVTINPGDLVETITTVVK